MKMVKSLLLGSAAGLVAVAGAQAADLPVKAKPVQYVKICDLYGAGFYYIPGTDTCLKIGGYLRVQLDIHAGGGGIVDGSQNAWGRKDRNNTDDFNFRTRFQFSMDIRTQTAYGTLRSYGRVMFTQTTPGDSPPGAASGWERAFIQFAGFTVGRAQSFFDIFTYGGAMSYHNVRPGGDTGAVGLTLWAYTAQFGNGVSATLSAEDPAGHNQMFVVDVTAPSMLNAGKVNDPQGGPANTGFHVPDIIGNVRVDQAWGYAGVSAALHDVGAAYYGTPNLIPNGRPDNEWGWAVAAGLSLNIPGMPGDRFGVQATWASGATGYNTNSGFWTIYDGNNSAGFAWAYDGVFNTGTAIELVESWSVVAGYQHIWNPQWRTAWYGGYVEVDYNSTATALICAAPGATPAVAVFLPGTCNPDYSFYQIGSRTQWNPVPLLDIGLDVLYTKLNTAHEGALAAPYAGRPGLVAIGDQEIWAAFFRIQRNWYP